MTSVFMGPLATQFLADLGADVIKIEAPNGDTTRHIGPHSDVGMGPLFFGVNRNKRSLVLDLKAPAGRAALLKLLDGADALTYNVRPQAMRRLGLDYASLAARNPRLIYVGMFGFSERGRYAGRPAYDDLIQAGSGLADAMARAGDGTPRYAPMTVADRSVGLYAFGVIASALFARERSGQGQRIDVPMLESFVPLVLGDHLYSGTFPADPAGPKAGYPRLASPLRRPYPTTDGYLCCMVYSDANWRGFLKLIGRPDMFDNDPRLRDLRSRTANINALYQIVADELAKRSTAYWVEALTAIDIPCLPMHTLDSVLDDPHLQEIGFFSQIDHPATGPVINTAVPSEWSATAPAFRRLAPMLGEHSREVLGEIGLTPAEIDALIAQKVTIEAPRR